jgi:hypothetical protein
MTTAFSQIVADTSDQSPTELFGVRSSSASSALSG